MWLPIFFMIYILFFCFLKKKIARGLPSCSQELHFTSVCFYICNGVNLDPAFVQQPKKEKVVKWCITVTLNVHLRHVILFPHTFSVRYFLLTTDRVVPQLFILSHIRRLVRLLVRSFLLSEKKKIKYLRRRERERWKWPMQRIKECEYGWEKRNRLWILD